MVKKLETINGELGARLKKLATSNKVTLDIVMQKFTTFRESGMDERTAVFAVVNEYRKVKQFQTFNANRKQRETEILYGFITGTNGIWDKAETIRRQANSFIKKNGIPMAQEQGFIDGENHILDKRQQIWGRPNPDYGKPLPETLHVLDLTLYGYFRHNGDKIYKFGRIQTSNNALARAWDKDIIQKDRYFTPCQVNAIIDSEDKTDIALRATTAKDSESVFKGVSEKWDIKTIIDKSTKFTPIKDVEKLYEQSKMPTGKMPFDHYVVVKGIVTYVNSDRPDALGRITVGLMNPDNEEELVRIRVDPSTVSLDFGELSEIYVFGKCARSMYKDRETGKLEDGDVVVDAFGIYAVVKTERVKGVEEDTSDTEVVEGWLD